MPVAKETQVIPLASVWTQLQAESDLKGKKVHARMPHGLVQDKRIERGEVRLEATAKLEVFDLSPFTSLKIPLF